MRIIPNYRHRPILSWMDLTEKERQEFDYLDSTTKQEFAQFFRYKGDLYDLGEFIRVDTRGWHGAYPYSYFTGLLIRYSDEYRTVQIARYYTVTRVRSSHG